MKRNETHRVADASKPPRKRQCAFNQVFDEDEKRVRGLWIRNGPYHAQVRFSPTHINRLPLQNAKTLPQLGAARQELRRRIAAKNRAGKPRLATPPELGTSVSAARGDQRAARGRKVVNPESNIVRVRGELGLSQSRSAAILGISADTLQNWEQGRRTPTGLARVLLGIAAKHPEVQLKVV